jgi:hypothetical protein
VAARVGTVASAKGAVEKQLWDITAAASGSATRGNADTTNLQGAVVYVRDSRAWRFGSYLSGALESTNGERADERAGLNLALARRYSKQQRVVLLEEIVRAPLDGLRARNLLGGMALSTAAGRKPVQASVYLGAGWANERPVRTPASGGAIADEVSGPEGSGQSNNYGAGLAGGTVTIVLAPHSKITGVTSLTQDLGRARNYKLGSTVTLDAAVTSIIGVQMSYSVAYNHSPIDGTLRTNQALNAGLTLAWAGPPIAPAK